MKQRIALIVVLGVITGCNDPSPRPEATNDTNVSIDTPPNPPPDEVIVPPPGVLPMIRLDGDLFEAPYPSDLRRKEGGGLDLSGFPNPNQITLVNSYVTGAEELLDGFSLTPSISFRFEGRIDADSVSGSDASWQPGSNVLLVDVDQDSFSFGRRFPLNAFWWGEEPAQFIPENSLTLQPLFGTPLAPGTTYACLILRDVRDPNGERISQPTIVRQGLEGEGPYADLYEPLRFWLSHGGNIPNEEIAVATVFTTGNATEQLRMLADYVQDTVEAPELMTVAPTTIEMDEEDGPTEHYDLYEGLYKSPNFQSGVKPYKEEGGGIEFGADGLPIVQEWEELRFALTVPLGDMPEAGWPLVLYGHGTTGDWKSFTRAQPWPPARELAKRGIAVMGIDQPLHGARYDAEDTDSVTNSFNFFNLDAARSNFRQSAIDVMVQARLARTGLVVPANVSNSGSEVRFDSAQIYFFGHSHGGLSGGLFLPFIQGIQAFVLSGAGGGLSHTIIKRKQPVDIAILLKATLFITNPDELSIAHPVIALMQNLVDITDPLSYAPLYINPGDEQPRNILLTEGTLDAQTPPIATDNLAAAAEIPILHPAAHPSQAHSVLGMSPVQTPLTENYTYKTNKATAGLAHFENDDHFTVFDNGDTVSLYTSFITSMIETGTPTID